MAAASVESDDIAVGEIDPRELEWSGAR